ncbi:MAG: amino-acid N-acetyltransferase [Verrucomicrobiales bacterium]|nr:amino-acid N-acetyltransferase [Verrucomicrobiales bacterium]
MSSPTLSPSARPSPRFEDLRGILRYVPQFRQRVFVIAIDGALIERPGFSSLLQDVAVLQSLNIEVVLVFGARSQIRQLAAQRKISLSNDDGMGRTDADSLDVAVDAITRQSSALMAALTALEVPVAVTNALSVHPAGVINGIDQEFTGRVERVDVESLRACFKADILPLLPPLGYDGKGTTRRLNSDAVAAEVGIALRAAKVIFVSESGLHRNGQRIPQLTIQDARELAREQATTDVNLLSKLRYGALACSATVPRVHIVDGTQEEALLAELFSNEGVGTMIHADDYHQIRPAREGDIPALMAMLQQSIDDAALVPRSAADIRDNLPDFFVLQVDGNPIGSVAVHTHTVTGAPPTAEIACLFVSRSHKNCGHGRRLVTFAEDTARLRGCQQIIALSTQAFRFFEEKLDYHTAAPEILPPSRREAYEHSARNSKILRKDLSAASNLPPPSA